MSVSKFDRTAVLLCKTEASPRPPILAGASPLRRSAAADVNDVSITACPRQVVNKRALERKVGRFEYPKRPKD